MHRWMWCLALVVACKKHSGGGEAAYEREMYKAMHDALVAPARRGPGFATAPEPRPPAKPAAAGPAYFVIKDVGLVTFAVDGTVTRQNLPLDRHGRVAVAPDGAVIVGAAHIYKLDHGAAQPIGGDDSPSLNPMGSPLEVAPDGTIWTADGMTVHGWDGTKWTSYTTSDFVEDFAFDGKGRVYTASAKQLGVIDGGTWKKMYDLEGTPHEGVVSNPRFGTIEVVGKQLVATHTYGILKLDGTNVEAIDRKAMDPPLLQARIIGDECLSLYKDNIIRTPLVGGPDKLAHITGSAGANIVQFDARGRAWTASGSSDLYVVDAAGSVTSWPTATIPEITSSIDAIYVVGNGPDKLPGKNAVAKGTIRGHVTKKGAAIAKAYVEICRAPLDRIPKNETPCGYTLHGTGETDDRGAFAITGLPLQDYTVVIRDGGQWYSLLGTTCGGMHDGDTCDIGELDVTNKAFPTLP